MCGKRGTQSSSPFDEDGRCGIDTPGPHTLLSKIPSSLRGLPRHVRDSSKPETLQSKSVTIFDWDDTLLPTWWATRVMANDLGHVELEDVPSDQRLALLKKAQKDLLLLDSKFRVRLEAHARAVEGVLRAAKAVSDVSVVTLGSQSWFEHSAILLPGLDVPALLQELDVEVYFAIQHLAPLSLAPLGANDIKVEAKKLAISESLSKHYGDRPLRWNVLSVGDQLEEHDALKRCCLEKSLRSLALPVCKTLKLPATPMLKDLTETLELLTPVFSRIVRHDMDEDWTFGPTQSCNSMQASLTELFSQALFQNLVRCSTVVPGRPGDLQVKCLSRAPTSR